MSAPFNETSYGIVKRLDVTQAWLQQVATRMSKRVLDILDVGCGTGAHLTLPIASMGHRVVGIDVHRPSIEFARAHHLWSGLRFEVGDIHTVAKVGDRFDVVICSEVLEHVNDPKSFLADVHRLIRPNGVLILTTPNGYGAYEWLTSGERVMRRLHLHQVLRSVFWNSRRLAWRLRGQTAPARPLEALTSPQDAGFLNVESGHVQFFTTRRLERLFNQSGFQLLDRRARSLLCGPYIDAILAMLPRRAWWYRWNNDGADRLPFACAADWMFLLRRAHGDDLVRSRLLRSVKLTTINPRIHKLPYEARAR